MIVLDTDAFTRHQLGHERFMERFAIALRTLRRT
jgi:hypothetical protein